MLIRDSEQLQSWGDVFKVQIVTFHEDLLLFKWSPDFRLSAHKVFLEVKFLSCFTPFFYCNNHFEAYSNSISCLHYVTRLRVNRSHTASVNAHAYLQIYTYILTVFDLYGKKTTDSLSSILAHAHAHPRIATIHFPSCTFIVKLHEGYRVIGLKSYTVLLHSNVLFCTMSSHSGASVNRAIVWSALPKGFTPISP